jgi:RNA polymerase sigma-70 factor (ECF subfamily)
VTSRTDAAPTAAVGAAASLHDPLSFEAAVRPLYAPLVRRLVLVLGNEPDAEDIAQDAYLRAFRSRDRFDGADVRAWLYTIALRLAFNQLRRRRRWLGLVSRAEPAPWHDRTDPDLWIALQRLDPRSRFALLANVLDGYTQREIATMLDVPEGTVSSWLSRVRTALRSDLGEG